MAVALQPLNHLFLGDVCREEDFKLLQNLRGYFFGLQQLWVDSPYRLVGLIEIRSGELTNKARIQAFYGLDIGIGIKVLFGFDVLTGFDST